MKKRAYYKNGILYDVYPRDTSLSLYEDRQTAYDATIVISDGVEYDISTVFGINSLPIPNDTRAHDILSLSYILKLHCGSVEDPLIIPPMVEKVLSIMIHSKLLWRRKDYLQVLRNFYRVGLFIEGDMFESVFRKNNPKIFSNQAEFGSELEHIKTKIYFENKARKRCEYDKMKKMFPDIVPKTMKGYLQIRTRKTKLFLDIKEKAESTGHVFNFCDKLHFCRKIQKFVEFKFEYDSVHNRNVKELISCSCSECSNICKGINDYGLVCCYTMKKEL